MRGLWTWPLRRLITKLEMMHIPGFLKSSSSRHLITGWNNGERNGQWANSRWRCDGSEHNRNNNSSMWPDNVLIVRNRSTSGAKNSVHSKFLIDKRYPIKMDIQTEAAFRLTVFTKTTFNLKKSANCLHGKIDFERNNSYVHSIPEI